MIRPSLTLIAPHCLLSTAGLPFSLLCTHTPTCAAVVGVYRAKRGRDSSDSEGARAFCWLDIHRGKKEDWGSERDRWTLAQTKAAWADGGVMMERRAEKRWVMCMRGVKTAHLQSQRTGVAERTEGRTAFPPPAVEEFTRFKGNQARRSKWRGLDLTQGLARHNNSDTIPAVPALPAFIYRCVLALSAGPPWGEGKQGCCRGQLLLFAFLLTYPESIGGGVRGVFPSNLRSWRLSVPSYCLQPNSHVSLEFPLQPNISSK